MGVFVCLWQSEEIFLDMFEDEYREMMVSYIAVCIQCLAFLFFDMLAKTSFLVINLALSL